MPKRSTTADITHGTEHPSGERPTQELGHRRVVISRRGPGRGQGRGQVGVAAPHVVEAGAADTQRDARAALVGHRGAVESAEAQQDAQQAGGGGPLEVEVERRKIRREAEVVGAGVERERGLRRVPVHVLERLQGQRG